MTTSVSAAVPSTIYTAAPTSTAAHRGWIESPAFDLPCFVLSPLWGLLFLAVVLAVPGSVALVVQAAVFYFVAVPHYMSTYTFYFGDENLRYFRTRWLAFFGGPAVISASVLLLWVLGFPPVIQAAVFLWNVWHVARQNSGVLAVYRRLNNGTRAEQGPAQATLIAVSASMALWNIGRYPPVGRPLAALHHDAARWFAVALLAFGAGALLLLIRRLRARTRRPSAQEVAFLAASVLMFHPYLWVRDYTLATLGMLMGHFVQYLAIVWLLHHRKYAGLDSGTSRQRVLSRVSSRHTLIACFVVASGLFFWVSNHATAALGVPSVYTVSWFAFTFIHFYLDGLIWAFRQPFVRESIGHYLMPQSQVAV
jgi:hypothetical protein